MTTELLCPRCGRHLWTDRRDGRRYCPGLLCAGPPAAAPSNSPNSPDISMSKRMEPSAN
ncbi:unnamed protein product [Tuwongella immobilis]|uniref:Uncharacterized protein n=1 Tax=Tuwongella immobilis TaxID=692036 RepID=A0A6C2YL96_9BACT|nr:unnamed protein product [Tuwongella immobilis]VTS00528.1 unnamed protein product [Tuwongella immobilis]